MFLVVRWRYGFVRCSAECDW